MSKFRSRLYAVLAALYFLGGVCFDVLVLGSLLSYEPINPFDELLNKDENSLLYLVGFFVALFFLGALIYTASLDPFRSERPWGLVYLNFLPVSFYMGVVFIPLVFAERNITHPIQAGSVLVIAFGLPLLAFAAESLGARFLLFCGRRFDEKGWRNAAYFFLKNSLRWRPSVHETARRAGLLLVESARFRAARPLLERLAPLATTEDMEVLRALEKVYSSEGEGVLALKCLQRQRILKPGTRGLDQRLLDQCLALEQWHDAIELLETEREILDLDKLALLQGLYVQTGNRIKALATARQMAERESAPFARAAAALGELLKKSPSDLEVISELGQLLQRTNIAEQMQRGAEYLEKVLERDPIRTELRRQLAAYYHQSMQHQAAEAHLRTLLEERDPLPETYLSLADIMKAKGEQAEACAIYRKLREICPEDWRGYFREAEILLLTGHLDEAAALLDQALGQLPESARLNINILRRKIEQRRQELNLQAIQQDLGGEGDDARKRLVYLSQLISLDRGEQAVEEADQLLQKQPSLAGEVQRVIEAGLASVVHGFRLRDFLSDLYFKQERFDETLKTYEVMAQDSLHPEKVIEQGCRKILTRAPNHLPARLSLAEVCMKTGNWEGVLAAYEPIMKSPPIGERLRILKRWVEAAFRAGKLKEAREQGLALLAEAKDDLSFMILVIKILEDCGDYQKAFDIFRAAAELFPEDETLHRMKRTVADNKKRNRMEELQRLDAEGKLTAQLNYEKADLHREFDQTHLAISHYQKASDDPELADMAMTKLAICLCDRRLFDLADETLDKINLTKEIVAKNPELKDMYYWMADTLEQELFKVAALKYFKRLFSVDASYKDVVIRLEKLSAK